MRKIVLLLTSMALGFVLTTAVAYAAFPGVNGKIAFVSDRDGNREIYKMNPDGSNQRRLTEDPANDTEPAWSANGRKIAFVSDRSGTSQIYVMGGSASWVKQSTKAQSPSTSPAWAPNGARLVFERDSDLYTVGADGAGGKRLTRSPVRETDPDWSPDGRKILFSRLKLQAPDRDKFYALCTISPTGADRSCFYGDADYFKSKLDFTPNGDEVVYQDCCTSSDHEWIQKLKIGARRPETLVNGSWLGDPAVSPDGKRIAFSSNFFTPNDDGLQVYMINADGSGQEQLTSKDAGQGSNYAPDWQPIP